LLGVVMTAEIFLKARRDHTAASLLGHDG